MSLFKRSALVAAVVGGLTLALAAPASAHVTVNPNTATPGSYSKVTFRVPNEKDSANTTKLEVNLPADRERVFDRFTRLDDARARDAGGTGLGLAIVRELVRRHHGTVTLGDASPGLRVDIRLPIT